METQPNMGQRTSNTSRSSMVLRFKLVWTPSMPSFSFTWVVTKVVSLASSRSAYTYICFSGLALWNRSTIDYSTIGDQACVARDWAVCRANRVWIWWFGSWLAFTPGFPLRLFLLRLKNARFCFRVWLWVAGFEFYSMDECVMAPSAFFTSESFKTTRWHVTPFKAAVTKSLFTNDITALVYWLLQETAAFNEWVLAFAESTGLMRFFTGDFWFHGQASGRKGRSR